VIDTFKVVGPVIATEPTLTVSTAYVERLPVQLKDTGVVPPVTVIVQAVNAEVPLFWIVTATSTFPQVARSPS
jgi:hypothetical protein